MAPASLLIAGLNLTQAETLKAGFYQFVVDRSLVLSLSEFFSEVLPEWLAKCLEWLTRPDILAIITAWWITFIVVLVIVSCIGFKPVGVAAGSAAAWFQSWMYGGFTPAGGIFATLTSMAMLGILMPLEVILASIAATIVSVIVWKNGYRLVD